jgi:hypothetical protein
VQPKLAARSHGRGQAAADSQEDGVLDAAAGTVSGSAPRAEGVAEVEAVTDGTEAEGIVGEQDVAEKGPLELLHETYFTITKMWIEETLEYHSKMGELSSAIGALENELSFLASRSEQQQDAVKQKVAALKTQLEFVERDYKEKVLNLQEQGAVVQEDMQAQGVIFEPVVPMTLELYDDDQDGVEDYDGPCMPSKSSWGARYMERRCTAAGIYN